MIAITPDDSEWYTPKYLLDIVRGVFPIDLDPCSNEHKTVGAVTSYTKEDNGLSLPWDGNIFMNPPYGREIGKWVDKFLYEWDSGHVKNAILLVPVKTDTKWWRLLSENLNCWCAIWGRVKFQSPDPHKSTTVGTFASCVILFTRDSQIQESFKLQFSSLGNIWA